MEEIFKEIVSKHLEEHYSRIKFYTNESELIYKEVWFNRRNSYVTYVHLSNFRHEGWYVRVHKRLKGKDALSNELSILGFEVLGDL